MKHTTETATEFELIKLFELATRQTQFNVMMNAITMALSGKGKTNAECIALAMANELNVKRRG